MWVLGSSMRVRGFSISSPRGEIISCTGASRDWGRGLTTVGVMIVSSLADGVKSFFVQFSGVVGLCRGLRVFRPIKPSLIFAFFHSGAFGNWLFLIGKKEVQIADPIAPS